MSQNLSWENHGRKIIDEKKNEEIHKNYIFFKGCKKTLNHVNRRSEVKKSLKLNFFFNSKKVYFV